MMSGMGLPGILFIVVWIVNIIALWKLLERSGSPGPLALLAIIPVLFPLLIWFVAFKTWPGDEGESA